MSVKHHSIFRFSCTRRCCFFETAYSSKKHRVRVHILFHCNVFFIAEKSEEVAGLKRHFCDHQIFFFRTVEKLPKRMNTARCSHTCTWVAQSVETDLSNLVKNTTWVGLWSGYLYHYTTAAVKAVEHLNV